MFREESGAVGLSGRDLPVAQALSGHTNVLARARQYEASGAFIGETSRALEALAYLHLLNGVTARDAIAFARTATAEPPVGTEQDGNGEDEGPRGATGSGTDHDDCPGNHADDHGSDNGGDSGEPGDDQPDGGSGPGGIDGGSGGAGGQPVLPEVTAPLATLQGRAERPGDNRLPARVNITVTETLLHQLAAQPRSGAPPGDWDFVPRGSGGGYGTWTLTLPGGRELTVRFDVVPTYACDHTHQVSSYQPSDRLRRLVQVRDYECTFPPCSRPARDSDFEHAVPYDQGGRTCACNAGTRSRRCHRVKQMPGWNVTQARPGWHEWTTPTGRTYVQGPWRYIA